jgi:hypothetical protein
VSLQKLNLNLAITYLGSFVCIVKLAQDPSYEFLVGLLLFIANLNLRKYFKHLQSKNLDNADAKIHALNKRILDLEEDYRKSMNVLKFQGIIR